MRARFSTLAMQLDRGAPPPVRVVEEPWELLVGWGLELVEELGGSPLDSNSENIDE